MEQPSPKPENDHQVVELPPELDHESHRDARSNAEVMEPPKAPAAPDSAATKTAVIESVVTRRTDSLRPHPDAGIVPAMKDDEYKAFRSSIRTSRILEPLAILETGEVLDGRHRLRAAIELGYVELPCRIVALREGQTAIEWIVIMATHRRDLTAGQRAAMALELESYIDARAEAALKQAATQVQAGQAPKPRTNPAVAGVPQPVGQKSRDVAATLVGVSGRVIQDALKVKAEAPDLFAKVKSGELTTNKAVAELKRRGSTESSGAGAGNSNPKQKKGQSQGAGTDGLDQPGRTDVRLLAKLTAATDGIRQVVADVTRSLRTDPNVLGSAGELKQAAKSLEAAKKEIDRLLGQFNHGTNKTKTRPNRKTTRVTKSKRNG